MLGRSDDRSGPSWQQNAAFVRARRRCISSLLIAALVFVVTEGAGCAQSSDRGAAIQFNIPSQLLEMALEAYGAASRLQVLYETSLTSGRRSTAVKGLFTQEAALRLLLSGTGLAFDYTEERAFTLVPMRGHLQAGQNRQIADFNQFLGGVQSGVMAALCRRPETRPGPFRLAMQFWVSGSGKLQNPNLLNSTGAAARDAAITDMLTHLAFDEAPPAGMPQPITMVLSAGSPNGEDECVRVGSGAVRP